MASPYVALFGAQIRAQLQYRLSFTLDTVAGALVTALDIAALLVLFRVTPALGGFSVRQALMMSGIANTAFALADAAVGNNDTMQFLIRNGRLDSVLVRPLRALPQLVLTEFQVRRIGRIIEGIVVLGLGLALNPVHWTAGRVALLVVAPLTGAVIFGSVFVAGSTVAFWFVESGEFANSFTYGGRDFTLYPTSIYPGWFRGLFAYGFGFAFVAYFPALAILGLPDPLHTPQWLAWSSPAVAALAALAAGLVWRTGIRHYRSTGS